MWNAHQQTHDDGRVLKVTIDQQGAPLLYSEVLRLWQDNAEFRTMFTDLFSHARFSAFRWETPPITASTAARPFEFVLLDSPGLDGTPDPGPFASQFASKGLGDGVDVFLNLGKDAILVVPRPIAAHDAYGHLAAFVRKAPEAQRHALWKSVGKAMVGHLGRDPVWLSTAGYGVSWLHVRLDARPKYYGYAPYKTPPRES